MKSQNKSLLIIENMHYHSFVFIMKIINMHIIVYVIIIILLHYTSSLRDSLL